MHTQPTPHLKRVIQAHNERVHDAPKHVPLRLGVRHLVTGTRDGRHTMQPCNAMAVTLYHATCNNTGTAYARPALPSLPASGG